jgi:hypothetical protein
MTSGAGRWIIATDAGLFADPPSEGRTLRQAIDAAMTEMEIDDATPGDDL